MQVRTEENPVHTGAQEVEHLEVLLPGRSSGFDALISTASSEQNRQLNAVVGDASFRQSLIQAPLPPLAIRGLDDRVLNKPAVDALRTATKAVQAFDEVRAAPIEVWEGEVKSVNSQNEVMHVYLRSKVGHFPDHAAEISLEWVTPQDKDLVRPGAVFYWSLYKETRRGSIRNSQELRFRRLPNWSKSQIQRIREESGKLFQNPKAPRVLEDPQG